MGELNMHKYKQGQIVHMEFVYSVKLKVIKHGDNPLKIKSLVMQGNWQQFGQDCGFEERKMLRIKLVSCKDQDEGGHNKKVPIFHVC